MDLPIASVNVNAVNCERLQAGDLQLTLCHRLLHKLKFSERWLEVGRAAVTASGLEGRDSAAAAAAVVVVQAIATGVSGVGDTKQVSTATVWWPGRERQRKLG